MEVEEVIKRAETPKMVKTVIEVSRKQRIRPKMQCPKHGMFNNKINFVCFLTGQRSYRSGFTVI